MPPRISPPKIQITGETGGAVWSGPSVSAGEGDASGLVSAGSGVATGD